MKTLVLPALIAASLADAATFTVPGVANPWLAGMPNGSTADAGDTAPTASPVLVTGLPIVPGNQFTLSATGLVSFRPDRTFYPPDGGPSTAHRAGAENGMGNFTAPLNALLGVFLNDAQPNLSASPPAFPYLPDAPIIAPSLKQVFFIGNGLTTTNSTQRVIVPQGATRFFLGVMDGFEWTNNVGSFAVSIEPIPTLAIRKLSSTNVQVSWTTNAPSYRLDSTDGLPAAIWNAVTNTPATVGSEFVVTVGIPGLQHCFRLRKP